MSAVAESGQRIEATTRAGESHRRPSSIRERELAQSLRLEEHAVNLARRRIVALSGAAALVAAANSYAHHSVAGQYDPSAPVTVEGTVVEVLMRNPHSQIRLEIADASGRAEIWTLEMDDVEDMAEQGISSETLHAGDEVIIFGFPARDGSRLLHIERLQRPSDGLEYEDD